MILKIYDTPLVTARRLIEYLLAKMDKFQQERPFHLALSGGETPALMFELWAREYSQDTHWEKLHLWWVDERCVPYWDSDSNYGLVRTLLTTVVPIPGEHVHAMRGEGSPEDEALRYSAEMVDYLPLRMGYPCFDLVFLGMGDDGHTASIFPGNGELLTTVASCVATRNPHTGQQRLTVTGQPLILSGEICFLVTGEKKSHIVGEVIGNPECCPASYVAHCGNHVSFFLDKSAAKKITP